MASKWEVPRRVNGSRSPCRISIHRVTRKRLWFFSVKFKFHEQDMMSEISKAFVKKYNGVWTCLAGPNIVYGTYPRPKNFIQFDIKEDFGCFCRIIIFQNGQEVPKL
ncbi:unnamed protein product, partial [Mesorhabditis belari]|uniref:Uncharacterized protein n=1 Tax=Mesorhabditis belari TaxID=2138241 RepID=A0AAF3FEX0_9BILA